MSAIRQQIRIDASVRAVWTALTTADGLTAWWADEARVDPRAGGRITVAIDEGEGPIEASGVFQKVRTTRSLDLKFDNVGKSPLKGTTLQFQLARNDGEAKLHVVHSGGVIAEDEEVRTAMDKQWKADLRALRGHLEG